MVLDPVSCHAKIYSTAFFVLQNGKFSSFWGGGVIHPHKCRFWKGTNILFVNFTMDEKVFLTEEPRYGITLQLQLNRQPPIQL